MQRVLQARVKVIDDKSHVKILTEKQVEIKIIGNDKPATKKPEEKLTSKEIVEKLIKKKSKNK